MPTRRLATLLAVLFAARVLAVPPEPQGDPHFWDGYHQALRQLRDDQWQKAVDTLTETEKLARGDRRLLLARGIARTLLADYVNARDDLTRAKTNTSRESTLWLSAISTMNDALAIGGNIPVTPAPRRRVPGPGPAPQDYSSMRPAVSYSGVPGALITGGKDYPTDYSSHVIYQLATPYRKALEAQKPVDEAAFTLAKQVAGRWFANRMLASADLAGRNYAWAMQLIGAGSLRSASEVLQLARMTYSLDADMAATAGDVWLRVGRPATARREYTVALTANAGLVRAYAGRAIAAATMGDARRARADLAVAKSLGGDATDAPQRVEVLLAKSATDGDPQAILAAMDQAAKGGSSPDQLLPDAIRLHRVTGARRVRYDEIYQDTLRTFDATIRQDPKNVEAILGVVQYLLEELQNRGEGVEPRAPVVLYRQGAEREGELGRAAFYADRALALEPRAGRAMVLKAMVLAEMGQEAAAAQLAETAAAAAGDGVERADPQAVRLLATFRRRQIARMLSQASALRTPTFSSSSVDEQRYDGVWRVTTTTQYNPSGNDLARAAALEAEARRLMDATKAVMESAVKLSAGTLDGYLLQSSYEDWFGSKANALGLLQTAVKEFATSVRAHDALVAYLIRVGQREAAFEADAVAIQLVQTSCAPLLTKAWFTVDAQGFGAMVDVLRRARAIDPTDARATVYLAESERDLRDKDAATAYYAVAVALETARLQLDDLGEAKTWPRRADELATLMHAHNMLGRSAKVVKQEGEEIAHCEATLALADRLPPGGRKAPMYGAFVLQANANRVPAPTAPNGAAVVANAALAAGNWYKDHNRMADAQRCWDLAKSLGHPARNDPLPRGKP